MENSLREGSEYGILYFLPKSVDNTLRFTLKSRLARLRLSEN